MERKEQIVLLEPCELEQAPSKPQATDGLKEDEASVWPPPLTPLTPPGDIDILYSNYTVH